MNQEIYWNNMLLSAENQNLPNYILSPEDANIPYVNMSTQDDAGLSIWTAGGPSSTEDSTNQGNHDGNKVERGWSTSRTANASGGLRIEEGHFEAANMLSLENVNINLNSSEVNGEQSFSQSPTWNDVPQIPEQNAAHVSIRDEDSETGPFTNPYNPGSSDVPSSSNPRGSSSDIIRFISENSDGRPGSSLDGLRLGCKRKIIEGVPGPSSSSGSGSGSFFRSTESNLPHSVSSVHNANTAISISRPSCYLSGASSSVEQLSPRFSPVTRGTAPDCYPPANVAGNSDSSQRNFRPRINPDHQRNIFPSHIFSSRQSMRRSSILTPNEPSSQLPFDQRIESRPIVASSSSQGLLHAPAIPGMPRHVHPFSWDGTPGSANGTSSSSINSGELLLATAEDANTRSVPRSSVSEQPLFLPPPVMMDLVQDSTNRIVTNRSVGLDGNTDPSGAGTSTGVHTPGGLTSVPHQNTPQFSRSLVEVVQRTLLPSVGHDFEGQSNNIDLQRSAHSAISQEIVHQSGSSSRRNQPPVMRSSLFVDRQSDGVPLSMRSLAAREGRSRMLSEIRNALDLMRRGEHVRFEDVFMLDHSVFRGAADSQDRHRDMRLDVDNMSYEELLALEERIGDVSTGLSEERISKCLKQRKHSSTTVTISMGTEPCCICQEEYMEGEDLGAVDCGHDFHAACIKQWLTHKNLCPICKTTALVT